MAELRKARSSLLARLARLTSTGIDAETGARLYDARRVEELLAQVDQMAAELGRRLGQLVTLHPEQALALADTYAAGILQARVLGSVALLNRPALVALQTYNLDLIRKVTEDLRTEIRSTILQGIIQGQSIPQISRQLTQGTALQRGAFRKVETRATVIARTETIRAFSQGTQWQFQAHGIRLVAWMTAKDDRVCRWCGPLDDQTFPLNRLPGGGPPVHPQCRCYLRPIIATTAEEATRLGRTALANARREIKRLATRGAA